MSHVKVAEKLCRVSKSGVECTPMSNSSKTAVVRRVQYGALPYRLRGGSRPQFMLITSRETRRWVIPKGHIEPNKSAGRIALQEAWEEAGLVGVLRPEPAGSYLYSKFNNLYHVTVFVLDVTEAAEEWPEDTLRRLG